MMAATDPLTSLFREHRQGENFDGCLCGWKGLDAYHPEHLAEVTARFISDPEALVGETYALTSRDADEIRRHLNRVPDTRDDAGAAVQRVRDLHRIRASHLDLDDPAGPPRYECDACGQPWPCETEEALNSTGEATDADS